MNHIAVTLITLQFRHDSEKGWGYKINATAKSFKALSF